MKKLYIELWFFFGRDCVLIILLQVYDSVVFEDDLFWVGHNDRIPNLYIERGINPILTLLNKILKQANLNNSKSKNC